MEAAAAITYSTLPVTLPALAGGTGACAMAPSFVIATPVASGAGATLLATTSKVLAFASNPVVLLVGVVALGLLFAGKKYLLPIYQAHQIEKARKAAELEAAKKNAQLIYKIEDIKNNFRKACKKLLENGDKNKFLSKIYQMEKEIEQFLKDNIKNATVEPYIRHSKQVVNAIAQIKYLAQYKQHQGLNKTSLAFRDFQPPYPEEWTAEVNLEAVKQVVISPSLFNAPDGYDRANFDGHLLPENQPEQARPLITNQTLNYYVGLSFGLSNMQYMPQSPG